MKGTNTLNNHLCLREKKTRKRQTFYFYLKQDLCININVIKDFNDCAQSFY